MRLLSKEKCVIKDRGGMELIDVILAILLVILIWNVKQGFEMIDERLRDIYEATKKVNKDDSE